MRILLVLHDFTSLRGVQMFSYTLAGALRHRHEVVIYAPHVGGEIAARARADNLPLCSDLQALARHPIDIVFVNGSHANACEARFHFPRTAMVFAYHASGGMPNRPIVDLGIARWLAVSEEVRDASAWTGAPPEAIGIFRSVVDTERFRPLKPLNVPPRTALIFSQKFTSGQVALIRSACATMRIECTAILAAREAVFEIEQHMNRADIVFTRGRGAIEAMACGRAVIVPGDGMMTADNLDELQTFHCSGRRFRARVSRKWLLEEMGRFHPGMAIVNRRLALDRFSVQRRVVDLEQILEAAMATGAPCLPEGDIQELGHFVSSLSDARRRARSVDDALRRQEALVNVHRSRHWRWLRGCYNLGFRGDRLISLDQWVAFKLRLLPLESRRRRLARSLRSSLWKRLSR